MLVQSRLMEYKTIKKYIQEQEKYDIAMDKLSVKNMKTLLRGNAK